MKVKKTQPKGAQTATCNDDETESSEPVVEDIFNELGTLIIAACAGKTSEQVNYFLMFNFRKLQIIVPNIHGMNNN